MKLTTIGELFQLPPDSLDRDVAEGVAFQLTVMTGRLHVSGDMGLAMRLQSLFPALGA